MQSYRNSFKSDTFPEPGIHELKLIVQCSYLNVAVNKLINIVDSKIINCTLIAKVKVSELFATPGKYYETVPISLDHTVKLDILPLIALKENFKF